MNVGKMHADEMNTDVALVQRLLAAQFPQWAGLPIEPVPSSGTVNAIYRLGDDMAVRMPRLARWARALEKEQQWLPVLGPHLPLAVPEPLANGVPGDGYPSNWGVYGWLDGAAWTNDGVRDLREAAIDLARFVVKLQHIDAAGGPAPRPGRPGSPLVERDQSMRAAIAAAGDMIDAAAVTAAWEAALAAPAWDGPPVWVHGDLERPGNLLVSGGRLSAVIDWGDVAVGDPACELTAAWGLFSGGSRDAYRAALGVDDATWARGRGWALTRVENLAYYKDTNPEIIAEALHAIAEVLAEGE